MAHHTPIPPSRTTHQTTNFPPTFSTRSTETDFCPQSQLPTIPVQPPFPQQPPPLTSPPRPPLQTRHTHPLHSTTKLISVNLPRANTTKQHLQPHPSSLTNQPNHISPSPSTPHSGNQVAPHPTPVLPYSHLTMLPRLLHQPTAKAEPNTHVINRPTTVATNAVSPATTRPHSRGTERYNRRGSSPQPKHAGIHPTCPPAESHRVTHYKLPTRNFRGINSASHRGVTNHITRSPTTPTLAQNGWITGRRAGRP